MRVGGAGLELSVLDIVREGPLSDADGSDVTRERTSRIGPMGPQPAKTKAPTTAILRTQNPEKPVAPRDRRLFETFD